MWILDCTTTESRDGLLLAKHRYYTHLPKNLNFYHERGQAVGEKKLSEVCDVRHRP